MILWYVDRQMDVQMDRQSDRQRHPGGKTTYLFENELKI